MHSMFFVKSIYWSMFVSLFGTRDVTILPTFNRRHKKSAKSHPLRPSSGAILPIYIRWHLPIYIRWHLPIYNRWRHNPTYLKIHGVTLVIASLQTSLSFLSTTDGTFQSTTDAILPIYNRWRHNPTYLKIHGVTLVIASLQTSLSFQPRN